MTNPAPHGSRPFASVTADPWIAVPMYETPPLTWTIETDRNRPSGRPAQAGINGLTVRRAGMYLVSLQIPWNPGLTIGAYLVHKVQKNGITVAEDCRTAWGWENVGHLSTLIPCADGDILSAVVVHSDNVPRTVGGTIQGGVQTRLAMVCQS